MVHDDVDFKINIYLNYCSYGRPASLFNDFLNEGKCV